MKDNIIATEKFYTKHRNYFFDFRQAKNHKNFINLVCSEKQPDNTYKRACIMIWEDHFEFLIEALSSLFSNAAHEAGRRGKSVVPLERSTGIKSWDITDRPREKFLAQGRAALSDAELLAMLIGSGTPGVTAVDLAQQILDSVALDMKRLAELPVSALTRFAGMGVAKALSIIAAMELAQRLAKQEAGVVWMKALRG
ncbi:UPF0758 domain-containing protein [Mucilaginibacter dorajii]|uniref:UPF0758 domain-containing protein n=1 Tax=Mucilaginibacter dorajii TaxID=692994 RepID=A0ABP7Q557_9SPHI|nr:UPF0758 domain-containing protein [Mucilaginibacter dorajii]MCS3732557.1 hypothetical protein [Mucilaginibacter dorajii]